MRRIGGVAGRVTDGFHRKQSWRDLLAPLVRRDLLLQRGLKDNAVVLEQVLHAAGRRAARLAVVHPKKRAAFCGRILQRSGYPRSAAYSAALTPPATAIR